MRTLLLTCLLLSACGQAPRETASVATSTRAVTAAPTAQLYFGPGWLQTQRGALVRGGHVEVRYERSRLSACAGPTVFSYARFLPGGQLFSSDEALDFQVPDDADRVELWFHAVAPGCEEWDSDYGRNWPFPVIATAPPDIGWAGDWGSSTNRACEHTPGVPDPIRIDEYMRERSCIFIDADVWVPGVTDVAAPHPEWIQAQVEWRKDASAPIDSWLAYQGIFGHNARFRFSVPYELRSMTDWSTATYEFRVSTDGNTWTSVSTGAGTTRTIERAF